MMPHTIWLVTSLSVAAAILLPIRARSEQAPTMAASSVYTAMLADSRCSGKGTAGARGRDLVMVHDVVVPMRQWWWNAFPHSDFPEQIPTWLPEIRSDTLQSFLELSARDSLVDLSVESGLALAWINRADMEQLSTRGAFWQEFSRRHPSASGYIELSSLGWSGDRRQALGYCGRTSESLTGNGFLVLLRYDERWSAIRWRQVWQS